jgi:hypothetical protein
MLTEEQIRQLAKPFRFEDHVYAKGKTIYIKKSAIRRRLSQVDPNWSLTEPELIGVVDNIVVVRGGLTVAGVTRYEFGAALISQTKRNGSQKVDLTPDELLRERLKAIKYAVSDVLPRCAIEFNCGAYLKDMTSDERNSFVVDDAFMPDRFRKWLAGLEEVEQSHWVASDLGKFLAAKIKRLNLPYQHVFDHIEPGRKLTRLSETTLSAAEFDERLAELAEDFHKPAAPKVATPSPDEVPATAESQPSAGASDSAAPFEKAGRKLYGLPGQRIRIKRLSRAKQKTTAHGTARESFVFQTDVPGLILHDLFRLQDAGYDTTPWLSGSHPVNIPVCISKDQTFGGYFISAILTPAGEWTEIAEGRSIREGDVVFVKGERIQIGRMMRETTQHGASYTRQAWPLGAAPLAAPALHIQDSHRYLVLVQIVEPAAEAAAV